MSVDHRIRVISVDYHPLVQEGIAAVVNSQSDMQMVGSVSTAKEALLRYRELKPDVTLIDFRLPDLNGIDLMQAIRDEFVDSRIIIFTACEGDAAVQRALAAGARGYLLKTMPASEIIDAIRAVHAGRKRVTPEIAARLAENIGRETLTNREIDVLSHVTGGNRNRDIAKRLFISEETVKIHIRHILEKLGATDRTHAMTIAARRGFIYL